MTDSTVQPIASASGDAHESDAPHDEHHVHVYPTSGIAEGNARVPMWFIAVIASLLTFFVGYIVVQWNAQPSSARAK